MKKCPICKKELEDSLFHGVEVDYCPKCLGIWFEKDELRLARDERDEEIKWLDFDLWQEPRKFRISYGERLCPSCRLPLYEVYYGDSGVTVDVCSVCEGVWLDRGEFKKIMRYLKEKSQYEILNSYVKNLIEEGFEIFVGPETFKEEVEDFLALLKVLNYKLAVQYPNIARVISELPK